MSMFDETPDIHDGAQRYPVICALAREHGWDTPLNRADHPLGQGVFQTGPVSLEHACAAALRQRGECRKWSDVSLAVLAIEADADPIWLGESGWRARRVLREQLLAIDALAEG